VKNLSKIGLSWLDWFPGRLEAASSLLLAKSNAQQANEMLACTSLKPELLGSDVLYLQYQWLFDSVEESGRAQPIAMLSSLTLESARLIHNGELETDRIEGNRSI
jgi:hypothetical protein